MAQIFTSKTIVAVVAALAVAACSAGSDEGPAPKGARSTDSSTPVSGNAGSDRPDISEIDFGTDGGDWANDGECDDPRFAGEGMTSTPLLDADIKADATDCRNAYERGELRLKGPGTARSDMTSNRPDIGEVDFGKDDGDWANDGECDDPRFVGPGMTNTTLLDDDIKSDATDCRNAYAKGELSLK